MKKTVLFAALSFLGFGAFAQLNAPSLLAQAGLISVTPTGANGETPITITLYPDQGCHKTSTLAGSLNANLHSGLVSDPSWSAWDAVYKVRFESSAATAFTANPNGTFSITLTPRSYFNVSTADFPVGSLIGMAFVVNGCADCTPGPAGVVAPDAWALDHRAFLAGTTTCADFAIPFPVPASLAPTGIAQSLTKATLLEPVAPNPFNGSTKIAFNLPAQAPTTVKITDMLGRTVQVLANETLAAGTHAYNFEGGAASEGIYFCQITSGSLTDAQKIIKAQ